MNKVELIGNVTKDFELQTSKGGLKYCNFTIAVPRAFKNEEGKKESDFVRIKVWRELADNVCKYVHKGDKVAVVGKIQGNSYEDEKGDKKYSTEIVADEVEFLVTKRADDKEELKPASKKDEEGLPF